MQISPSQISSLAGRTVAIAEALADGMNVHLPEYEITTPLRVSHWLAQVAHETGGFQWLHELGGPRHFAKYDGRKDLGNTEPGDGFRFRGRGLIQLTGRANYQKYGDRLGLDLIGNPDLAAEPANAVLLACAFWGAHALNPAADRDDILAITRAVNGGQNGLDDRKRLLAHAKQLLGI